MLKKLVMQTFPNFDDRRDEKRFEYGWLHSWDLRWYAALFVCNCGLLGM